MPPKKAQKSDSLPAPKAPPPIKKVLPSSVRRKIGEYLIPQHPDPTQKSYTKILFDGIKTTEGRIRKWTSNIDDIIARFDALNIPRESYKDTIDHSVGSLLREMVWWVEDKHELPLAIRDETAWLWDDIIDQDVHPSL